MMRRILFLLSALAFSLTLAFFPGCGGGDDGDNPSGPGGEDTLTTDEVLTTLGDLGAGFTTVYDDCQATYIVNGLMNGSGAGALFFQIALDALGGDPEFDITDYYGTWDLDTSTVLPGDMALVDSLNPSNAVKIEVIGVDTTGGTYPGDITLYNLVMTEDSVYIKGALHVDATGDSMSILIDGSMSTGNLSISGNACGLAFYVEGLVSLTDSISVSGWYSYPSDPTVHFAIGATLTPDTTGTIHVWTTESPTVDVTVNFQNDPDSCVTGAIKINGNTEATIYAANCDADTIDVYVLIDGQQFTLEDLFGELYSAFWSLYGTDIPSPLIKQSAEMSRYIGR